MTDENVVEQPVQGDASQETPKPPELTPEQIQNMRNHLIDSVNKEYHRFLSGLTSLPFPISCFSTAFMFLDTGMLWMKEAISYSPFVNKVPPQAQAPTQPEVKPEEEVA